MAANYPKPGTYNSPWRSMNETPREKRLAEERTKRENARFHLHVCQECMNDKPYPCLKYHCQHLRKKTCHHCAADLKRYYETEAHPKINFDPPDGFNEAYDVLGKIGILPTESVIARMYEFGRLVRIDTTQREIIITYGKDGDQTIVWTWVEN